jgi:hypothetical protein
LHLMCCRACHQSIADLYASVDECLQAMEAMKQRMEDLERVVEDDYKFLNRNVRKLFGMVGNMRGKWCNTCLNTTRSSFLLRIFVRYDEGVVCF